MSYFGQSSSERQPYLIGVVRGSTLSLSTIRDLLQTDSQGDVRSSGPSDNPTRLKALLTPKQAEHLSRQYGSELIVEKDAPLREQEL
jgi:hypothetical protein